MVFGVQDGDFLPEGAFDFEGHDAAGWGGEKSREVLGDPGGDGMMGDGPLIGEGPELKFDLWMDVAGGFGLRGRVAEREDG